MSDSLYVRLMEAERQSRQVGDRFGCGVAVAVDTTAKTALGVFAEWLRERAPERYDEGDNLAYDAPGGAVQFVNELADEIAPKGRDGG